MANSDPIALEDFAYCGRLSIRREPLECAIFNGGLFPTLDCLGADFEMLWARYHSRQEICGFVDTRGI